MFFFLVWITVQLLVEMLPISSSGHVALLSYFFSIFNLSIEPVSDLKFYDFLLHIPTAAILLIYFFKRWWKLIFNDFDVSFKIFDKGLVRKLRKPVLFFFVADGITVFVWIFDLIPRISLCFGFMLTALILLSTKYFSEKNGKNFEWSLLYAFILGLVQSFSLMSGVSRFGSTFAAGQWFGYSKKDSLSISFLVEFPLLIAGMVKVFVMILKRPKFLRSLVDFGILFAMLSATVLSYFLLSWVDKVIQKGRIWRFALYMILPILITCFS